MSRGDAITWARCSEPSACWTPQKKPTSRHSKSTAAWPAGSASRWRRYAGLAEVAYQRNELDTALRHVTEGIPLCRQFVFTPPLAAGLAVLAWIRQAQGKAARRLEAIGEAGLASPGPDVPGLLNPVPAQRARLLLAQGDVAGAARWTQERGLGAGDEPDYPWEPEYLVLARVLLAQDRPGPAFALLGRLHAAATPRAAPAASSRSRRCRRWPWCAAAMRTPRWTAWLSAHARLPPGLCPGVRRRGRADGRAGYLPGRGAEGGPRRRPRGPDRLPDPAAAGVRRKARRPGRRAQPPARRCRAWSSS